MKNCATEGGASAASVDWVTCTQLNDDRKGELVTYGKALVEREVSLGERLHPLHLHGYCGYHAGRAAWGMRGDSAMVRVSSELADASWWQLAPLASRFTRLDLAVTVDLHQPDAALAVRVYERPPEGSRRRGRPPVSTLIQQRGGGATLYLGARTSEKFGRLYDKGREERSAPPGLRWRWEVELKGDAAGRALSRLLNAPTAESVIRSSVAGYFSERGAPDLARLLEISCTYDSAPSSRQARPLEWLSAQVRPCVQRLVDAGLREQVLAALGLASHTESTSGGYVGSLGNGGEAWRPGTFSH